MTRLLTTREAAARLGMQASTLVRWRWAGIGPRFIQIGNRSVRYQESAIADFIALTAGQGGDHE
jgi:predicted DNA-binding transcriptional regulator AlpA